MKLLEWGNGRRLFPAKLLVVMRITAAILLMGALHVSAKGTGQTVSYSGKNVRLEEVFSAIKQQTDYVFFYKLGDLRDAKPVTVDLKNVPLKESLDRTLENQSLDFSIEGNTIFIIPKSPPPAGLQKEDTARLPASGEIHGHILTKDGVPLGGANIIIKRTKIGTQTNIKGEFNLVDTWRSDELVVSFIGYKTITVKVGDGKDFPIVLELSTSDLDRVIVQGYGNTTQRFATGSIATVTAAEIEKQPVMNPLEALFGRVPGMVVTQVNGYASAPINVEIRGRAGIGSNSDPLIIIDGVPWNLNGTGNGHAAGNLTTTPDGYGVISPAGGQSPLFSFNPLDIETVTVLKDADATAIYGSRGGNGVIIITTKKGKIGKLVWDANVYQGVQKITGSFPLMNTQQYLAMRREAFKNDGITPDAGNAYDLLVWDTTRYTNFEKKFWGGLGNVTDFETGISGGDRQTNYRLSGDYHTGTSIFQYSGADARGSIAFNLSSKSLNQKLALSFSSIYSYAQSNLKELTGNVVAAPNSPPIFDKLGNLNYAGWAPGTTLFSWASLKQPYIAKTRTLNSSLNIRYELFKGMGASVQLGYSTQTPDQEQTLPIASLDPTTNPKGVSEFGHTNYVTTIIEPQLDYKGNIGSGKLDIFLGSSLHSESSVFQYAQGEGYVNDNLLNSVANAPVKLASDGTSEYKYNAIFGRINYNWNDKYILNFSARRDGSSRFGPGDQFGNFGAVGGAWIFTEEKWVKDHLPFLSFGKFRGSYGLTGSDGIPDYQFLTRWTSATVPAYLGLPAYVPIQHADPILHWETDRKLEGAVNFGFFKNRLNIEFALYRNRIGDQLVSYLLPEITGFTYVYANFPATVQNSGLETIIHAKMIDKKDLSWTFNFQMGRNRNKLLAFPNIAQSPYNGIYIVGQPLNLTLLLHYTGVDPQTGQYTFTDKNKNGVLNTNSSDPVNDLFVKDLSIKLDGGFGTDFSFKQLQVSIFFNFRQQVLQNGINNSTPGSINNNQSLAALNHWQKPGDKARFARYTTNSQSRDGDFYASDGYYEDGSYIRLKNISLSYDFPAKLLSKTGLKTCSLFLHAENIFVLTRYDGVDPDVPGLAGLPPAKTITLGIQFKL